MASTTGRFERTSPAGAAAARPGGILPPPPPVRQEPQRTGPGSFRQAIEFFVGLIVAVSLFRTFVSEGYRISTGSMAPTLLGRHRPAVCPECKFAFAVGASDRIPAWAAVCPNCAHVGIDLRGATVNDGDQLLVNPALFELRPVRRWETIVFRSPVSPQEAHVKRVVGLPGETVELRWGDVWIDGQIARKNARQIRAVRQLIHEHRAAAASAQADPDALTRWVPQGGWEPVEPQEVSPGGAVSAGFRYRLPTTRPADRAGAAAADPAGGTLGWLTYRHTVRSGGRHSTSAALDELPAGVDADRLRAARVEFDPIAKRLLVRGVLTTAVRDELAALADDEPYRQALQRLCVDSHESPILDDSAYNRPGAGDGSENVVRDLQMALRARMDSGDGLLVIELTDGDTTFAAVFDAARQQIRLEQPYGGARLRTAMFPPRLHRELTPIEFSNFDQQIVLAVDGAEVFDPWTFDRPAERGEAPRRPVRVGAQGGTVQIAELRLYRDVYYRRGRLQGPRRLEAGTPIPGSPIPLDGEYFVLGDNSPVSADARDWPPGVSLRGRMIVGKPFLVHLPSRMKTVRIGGWEGAIRVPEFSRIRYIH